MTTILGFVLSGNPSAQHDVEKSVLGQFPVIGNELTLHSLTGKVSSLVIGLSCRCWAPWASPTPRRTLSTRCGRAQEGAGELPQVRLRGLALFASLGIVFLIATIITGFASGIHGPLGKLAAIATGLVVNLGLSRRRSGSSHRTPCRRGTVGRRDVRGSVLDRTADPRRHLHQPRRPTREPVGEQFALVIGLLLWLHLGAQVTLYAAEINVVLARSLWPAA